MYDRHDLVNSVVSRAIDLLIESKSVYIKHKNKGNETLFINTEPRDDIFDALYTASDNSGSETFYQNHRPWQENQDAMFPLLNVIAVHDDDFLAKTVEKFEETIPVSDSFESPFTVWNLERKFIFESQNQSFISLEKLSKLGKKVGPANK